MTPPSVYFEVAPQLHGMSGVNRILMASQDQGVGCVPALAISKLVPRFQYSTRPEPFLEAFEPHATPSLSVEFLFALLSESAWGDFIKLEWNFFRLINRFRRAVMGIVKDTLQTEQGEWFQPRPAEGSLAWFFNNHLKEQLATGGAFDEQFVTQFLYEVNAIDLANAEGITPPIIPEDQDITRNDIVKLNRVIYIACAFLALADIAGEEQDPGDFDYRLIHITNANLLLKPWFAVYAKLPILFFLTAWPLWELLDRLECRQKIRILMPPAAVRGDYYSVVFPFREKVSNYVRTCKAPYCDHNFFELMESVRTVPNLRLLEVGANLGDCALWATSMYDVDIVAFEPIAASAEVFRRSIGENRLEDKITLHEIAIGNHTGEVTFYQTGAHLGNGFAWAASTDIYAGQGDGNLVTPNVTVPIGILNDASLVPIADTNDILKLWVYGDTLKVLRAGRNVWGPERSSGRVAAIWVAMFADYIGDETESALDQLRALWDIFDEAGMKYIDCPSSTVTCNRPEDALPLAGENNVVFTLIASREPFTISSDQQRDLTVPPESGWIGDLEATRTDEHDVFGCGFTPSKSQEDRFAEAGRPPGKLMPSFL